MPTSVDDSPDLWFARYRRDGDAQALARVFDATAPRLLRIAIHFAGDVGAAEDLVQATFVTAIERAASFDASKSVEPWLTGILAHHARRLRREAMRVPDLQRLIERTQSTPFEEAITSELSGQLASALDRLEEPYRQTLILRVRHGMKSADIAHLLGESPGAVRVRIHRGLEKLRNLLPAGVALSGVLALEPARGMSAVKEIVLAKAATPVAAGSSLVIGGMLVGKKLALVGIGIAGLIALWCARSASSDRAQVPLVADRSLETSARAAEPASAASPTSEAFPAIAAQNERAAIASSLPPKIVPLRGRVVQGETDTPIAGARVRLFLPRTTTLSEVERRWADRILIEETGAFSPIDAWPWIPDPLSDLARADREDVTVYDAPLAGVAPIAECVSALDGTFDLPATEAWGFVECSAQGFADRDLPACRVEQIHRLVDGQLKAERLEHDALVVRMWRSAPLSGYVIDDHGESLHRRMKFLFRGSCMSRHGAAANPFDPSSVGSWVVETDDEGRFAAELAAPSVHAVCIEPGFSSTNVGIDPKRKERRVFETSFRPGVEKDPVLLVVKHRMLLHVKDATSGKAIETVWISSVGMPDGYPRHTGKFRDVRGAFALAPDIDSYGGEFPAYMREAARVTVWAEGYLAKTLDVENPADGPDVEVALERGELPVLRGIVRSRGDGVAGAVVSIFAFGQMGWHSDDGFMLDSAKSSTDGGFQFTLPAGDYRLRCKHGDVVRNLTLHVPANEPCVFDLDRGGSILVHVRDSNGVARSKHNVALHGDDGRSAGTTTDEQGSATFDGLTPGKYTVFIPWKSGSGPFSADSQQEVALANDEHRTVDFQLPSSDPRHPRLIVDDGNLAGWRARDPYGQHREWVDVQADGTVPIEIQLGVRAIEVQRDKTRRWNFGIPKDPPDGLALRVARHGPGYCGTLRNWSGDRTLAHVGVLAYLRARDKEAPSCVACTSDAHGRFELTGLEAAEYELSFRFDGDSGEDTLWWDRSLGAMTFLPSHLPAESANEIEIRLPKAPRGAASPLTSTVISGKLLTSGSPAARIQVCFYSFVDNADGALRLVPQGCFNTSGEDGSYRVTVPRAERYHATFYDKSTKHAYREQDWTASAQSTELVRDFDLE
jgi:RNA polymerase sigma-70 factor (ECF subfamily)